MAVRREKPPLPDRSWVNSPEDVLSLPAVFVQKRLMPSIDDFGPVVEKRRKPKARIFATHILPER